MKLRIDRSILFQMTSRTLAFIKSHPRAIAALALLIAIAVLTVVSTIKRRAQSEFEIARSLMESRALAPFEKDAGRAFQGDGVMLLQSSRRARGVARFNGSIFAPTDGGLVEFGEDGEMKRRYTTLDGLAESDLTSIAVFNSKLYAGSRTQGLIVFDGKRFERYRWTDREAQAVTVLLEDRGRLLVGTFAGGLLEFDGRRFREIKAESAQEGQKRFGAVNCLVAEGPRLFVGTFADGLWVSDSANSGGWSHFTIADGLSSNRVVGIVVNGERLIVASDFGVAAASFDMILNSPHASQRRFHTVATIPELSSAIGLGADVLLCKDNGEIFRLSSAGKGRDSKRIHISPVSWKRPESLSSCQLAAFVNDNQPMGDTLWLTSGEGLWRLGWQGERLSGSPRISRFGESSNQSWGSLKSNVISALAFDDLGRLWAGSFRDGIDVIAPDAVSDGVQDGRRVAHLESETLREINALVWDKRSGRMLAATSQGLISFDGSFGTQRLSAADGLLSNSILDAVAIQGKGAASFALATSRGLSLGESSQWMGLTTVHGLPSDNVYSVHAHREFIYAGTVGGLAQIAGGRVVRVFKDSNSRLSHNWVTAVCEAGSRLFIGTYGGGVFELTAAGEFVSYASEIGRIEINPNAMASDGERLYAGSLDGAWALDLRSQKWKRLKDELPSGVVLSVGVDGEHVYFGTNSGIARIRTDYVNHLNVK